MYVGCNEPLLGDKRPTSDYHGSDGFGDAPDAEAPDASHLHSEHAVNALIRVSKEHKGREGNGNLRHCRNKVTSNKMIKLIDLNMR